MAAAMEAAKFKDIPKQDLDDCREVFGDCVAKRKANSKLPAGERKTAPTGAVKDMLATMGLKEDAALFMKHADKKTKHITFPGFMDMVYEMTVKGDNTAKLQSCCKSMAGKKGHIFKAAPKTDACTDRLCDTTKYTGSHASRFDETGKGKGKAGREELHANDGYVGGYKNKDTYDKK